MAYFISHNASGDKVDYIDLKGEPDYSEIQEIVQIGAFDRIQTQHIPTRETLVALNDLYYSKFPATGFRLYGFHEKGIDDSFFEHLSNLEKLNIDTEIDARNLVALSCLKNLKSLRLSIYQLKNFSFVSEVSEMLEQFSLETKNTSFDISSLGRFQKLKVLNLSGYKKNIESLSELPSLESLLLRGITLEDVSFLNNISNLKSLKIHRGNTKDFSGLYGNTSITALQILRVTHFSDVELLAELPNLTAVELNQLKHIDHLPDLSNHNQLRHISLDELKSLTELSPLEHVRSLESVSFSCCPQEFEPDCILPVLRNPAIKQCSFYTGSDKKNKRISQSIEEAGKENRSNFMTVRNMLYANEF